MRSHRRIHAPRQALHPRGLRYAQHPRNRPLAAFLDMRKTFDTVNHQTFIALFRARGIPESSVTQLVKMLAGRQTRLLDALISLEYKVAQRASPQAHCSSSFSSTRLSSAFGPANHQVRCSGWGCFHPAGACCSQMISAWC
jgi:hypothetical protein